MVSVDGGRLQIRSADPSEPKQDGHWRESKVSRLGNLSKLMSMKLTPMPMCPAVFFDLKRTKRDGVRGLGHPLPARLGNLKAAKCQTRKQEEATEKGCSRKPCPGRPKRLVHSVLASRKSAEDFGPMMHQAAWDRNFLGAKPPGFLGRRPAGELDDPRRRHFACFTPILDFVHALSYVFARPSRGVPRPRGRRSIGDMDLKPSGRGRSQRFCPSWKNVPRLWDRRRFECADSDPRKLVFESLRYLKNNTDRMRYDDFTVAKVCQLRDRAAVESAIKMINKRVKGSEKFWSEPGAEAILQLPRKWTHPERDRGHEPILGGARGANQQRGRVYRLRISSKQLSTQTTSKMRP